VGPNPTLPSNQHPAPANGDRGVGRHDPDADRDLVLGVAADQPPPTTSTDREAATDVEHAGAAARLHHELAEAAEASRAVERPAGELEPAGRRLPMPLTGREGVER
jgi:hypothetical protein